MAIVITSDNVPAALALIAERQDELGAQLEALTALCADQAVRAEEQEEQIRVQAQALRATATQLSRNISDVSRAANGNGNGNRTRNGSGNGAGNGNGSNGNGNPGNDRGGNNPGRNGGSDRVAGARLGGEANVGPALASAEISGGLGKPDEPSAPERRRAHRWI